MGINGILGPGGSLFGQGVQNINTQLTNLSTELATGKISTTYAGFGINEGFAVAARSQLTDITAVPQARLNLEQQVSPDITLTYITNLARTDQQIVRIEWDLSKRWSVVALRDENGAFGVDFQVRKRFK